jgi:hypothetical protein
MYDPVDLGPEATRTEFSPVATKSAKKAESKPIGRPFSRPRSLKEKENERPSKQRCGLKASRSVDFAWRRDHKEELPSKTEPTEKGERSRYMFERR